MATRFQPGYYGMTFIIDNHTTIEYSIETCKRAEMNEPGWTISQEISSTKFGIDSDRWTTTYPTKKSAVKAINELQEKCIWFHDNTLGWCIRNK